MKQIILIIMMVLTLALSGCSGEKAAKDLLDTAKLEELQNNTEHARQLYEEIVSKYPDTQYAKTARERLKDLEKK